MRLLLVSQTQGMLNDPATVLRNLLDQESALMLQLDDAKSSVQAAKMIADRSTGEERADHIRLVQRNSNRVEEIQQRLEVLHEQIAATRREIGTARPPSYDALIDATIAEQQKIFNLKPGEFYGSAGFVLLLPLVLALAHRIWRGGRARATRDHSLDGNPQITRLEQAVESIAIEVERISEAQRFSAKLLSERPVEPVIERLRESKVQRRVVTPLP